MDTYPRSEIKAVETPQGPRWVLRRLQLLATSYWHVARGEWQHQTFPELLNAHMWQTGYGRPSAQPAGQSNDRVVPLPMEQRPEYWFPSEAAAEAARETADTWRALEEL
jgi:hypothetical protein